jgi:hypothetical protein
VRCENAIQPQIALFERATEFVHPTREDGVRYDGFWGWDRTPLGDFIERNYPADPQQSTTQRSLGCDARTRRWHLGAAPRATRRTIAAESCRDGGANRC